MLMWLHIILVSAVQPHPEREENKDVPDWLNGKRLNQWGNEINSAGSEDSLRYCGVVVRKPGSLFLLYLRLVFWSYFIHIADMKRKHFTFSIQGIFKCNNNNVGGAYIYTLDLIGSWKSGYTYYWIIGYYFSPLAWLQEKRKAIL